MAVKELSLAQQAGLEANQSKLNQPRKRQFLEELEKTYLQCHYLFFIGQKLTVEKCFTIYYNNSCSILMRNEYLVHIMLY